MKTLLKFLFLAAVATILMSSCKKETIYPTDQLPANTPKGNDFGGVSHWGTFKLISSQKHFATCWTGSATYFTDADTSSLRWGGSNANTPIETIIKNSTTWTFVKPATGQTEGKFILNGDTSLYFIVSYVGQYSTIINDYNDPHHAYGTNIGFNGVTVIGNGYTAADSVVSITISNGYYYHHTDGHDYEYKNVLLFKKM